MSTAIAAPSAATIFATSVEHHLPSPRPFASIAPPNVAATASAPPSVETTAKRTRSNGSPGSGENTSPVERTSSVGKTSPVSLRSGPKPMIKVKQEPGSPPMQSARPRPKRLDLSSSMANSRGPQTARPSAPLTSRESAGLAIQDVGLACLSPGFQTHDPAMREQLQRSLDVRDQQRQIIEARQKGQKPGSSHETPDPSRPQDTTLFGVPTTRTPMTSRRKGPPPGLSINAPSATQFASDRVIQSAPIHQTFTGLRPGEHPFTRHVQHGPSGLGQTSHIHHVPATQTNNRLPPIADVFAHDRLNAPRGLPPVQSPSHSSHSNVPPPLPSPGFGPPPQHHGPPLSARPREFRSAEEAMQGLSGGRDELLPKVVHYGGVQPPTPPSPMPMSGHTNRHQQHAGPGAQHSYQHEPMGRPDILSRTMSMNGRRRGRDEYERDNGSPPTNYNQQESKRAAFAVRGEDREEDWRSNLSSAEKREEFLRLCERAWDLFHS